MPTNLVVRVRIDQKIKADAEAILASGGHKSTLENK